MHNNNNLYNNSVKQCTRIDNVWIAGGKHKFAVIENVQS